MLKMHINIIILKKLQLRQYKKPLFLLRLEAASSRVRGIYLFQRYNLRAHIQVLQITTFPCLEKK